MQGRPQLRAATDAGLCRFSVKGNGCSIPIDRKRRPAELDIVGQLELLAVHINAHCLMHRCDLHGVGQRQIAVVLHLQIDDLGVARLPQGVLVEQLLRVLCGEPCLFAILTNAPVLQTHVQIAGYDPVDAGGGRICKPCKCTARQHRQAQHKGQHTGQQRPFGSPDLLFLSHVIAPLFLCLISFYPRFDRIVHAVFLRHSTGGFVFSYEKTKPMGFSAESRSLILF